MRAMQEQDVNWLPPREPTTPGMCLTGNQTCTQPTEPHWSGPDLPLFYFYFFENKLFLHSAAEENLETIGLVSP